MNQSFTKQGGNASRYYRIGNLTLDTSNKTLTKDNGEQFVIAGKNYSLLEVLVKASPVVLSVNEIHELVWHKTRVSDDTVRQRITILRKLLNVEITDDAYIQVTHGEGYSIRAVAINTPLTTSTRISRQSIYRNLLFFMLLMPLTFAIVFFNLNNETKIQVAVKPFSPIESTDVLIANGFTEELIHKLVPIEDLSISKLSHSQKDESQAIIEGSVHKNEDYLTISISIIDAKTGEFLWVKKYNEKLHSDIYEIQANIAAHVALILKVNFDDNIYKLIAQGPTANIDAYYYYIQGVALTNSGKITKAKQAFSAALLADPNFTLANETLNKLALTELDEDPDRSVGGFLLD